MAKRKKAVILLPTFNEKDVIKDFIKQVFAQQKNIKNWTLEILVVDGGSTDGTREIVKSFAKKNKHLHFHSVKKGLGVAFILGHKYAIKKFNPGALLQLDADGQTVAQVIPKLLINIDKDFDLVIGSRFVKGGRNELPIHRQIFSYGSSLFCRVFMGYWSIKEFSNSTRAFTPELFKKINLDLIPWQEKTYIVLPSFLHAAMMAGAKYKEVPVIIKQRSKGYSKMKIINYTYDVITYAIDVRLKKMGLQFDFFNFSRGVINKKSKKIESHNHVIEQVPPDYYQKGVKNSIFQKYWHTHKLKEVSNFIKKYSEKQNNILDVGSASGWFLSKIKSKYPKSKCYGIDVYEDAINYGNKIYPKLILKKADAQKIPFKNNFFDIVISTETLEHVNDSNKVLKEMKRVLKKDGLGVIEIDSGSILFSTVWYFWTKLHGKVWTDSHLHSFTIEKLEKDIKNCGFQVLDKKKFNFGMAMVFAVRK